MDKEQEEYLLWPEPGDLAPKGRSNLSPVWPEVQTAELGEWTFRISDFPGAYK